LDLQKRIDSFKYAITGIKTLIKTQMNMKIHLIAVVLVTMASFLFKVNATEWCLLILIFTLVMAAEAVNTAIEFVVDLVSPDYHPLAGKAKDVAAGAVLITAIGAVILGLIIFLPKIWVLISK
jgi:diacylglycerol kinase (ATP)